jgi:outer membrane protein, heavy metal efflux system
MMPQNLRFPFSAVFRFTSVIATLSLMTTPVFASHEKVNVSARTPAGTPVSLENFLQLAKKENLSLKISEAQINAANAGAVGWNLPAPMLGLSHFSDESGATLGFEFSQALPFPTKLSSDQTARKAEVAARQAERAEALNSLLSQVRLIYFQLWQSQQRLLVMEEKKRAIEEHLKLANAGARSDSFQKIHILKAESDLDLLENEIFQIKQEFRERQINAALLVSRSPQDFQPLAEELPLSPLPATASGVNSYQVLMAKSELEKASALTSEARATWLPDFNLRFRQMNGTASNPRYAEVMVGVSLPFLYFWQASAAVEKASAEQLQAERFLQLTQQKVAAEKESRMRRAESLFKQIQLIREHLIPRAEKRQKLVHNLAPRDMEILQDHRETMEALPDLKLKLLDLRGQYEEAIAELNRYSTEVSE